MRITVDNFEEFLDKDVYACDFKVANSKVGRRISHLQPIK